VVRLVVRCNRWVAAAIESPSRYTSDLHAVSMSFSTSFPRRLASRKST
jgi:hypothetical protein